MAKSADKPKKNSNFGLRLQATRKEAKKSPSELARMLDLNNSDVIKAWESGAAEPDCRVLRKLARVLPVDLHELVTGSGSPAIDTEVCALRALKADFRQIRNSIDTRFNRWQAVSRAINELCDFLEGSVQDVEKKYNVQEKPDQDEGSQDKKKEDKPENQKGENNADRNETEAREKE